MTKLTDIGQILALCAKMTNLKLEVVCGFDRQFATKWYENEYLTGRHIRYVMKPDKFIASVEDGMVYRAFNTPDAKAVELMESNPEYRDFFIDMEPVPNTIPELGDDPFAPEPEVTEPEVTEPTEPGVTEPTEPGVTEPTEEEIAAAKRSAAAKKAAATRAAKKAAEEAENADISEFE
nr:MAG TPA_asm: hypothetical protein [Caudoviricetes sp.]